MTSSKRSTSKSDGDDASTSSTGANVTSYDKALEAGYFGGPADDTDYTAGAEQPPIDEVSLTHDVAPQKAAELQKAVAEATDPNKGK